MNTTTVNDQQVDASNTVIGITHDQQVMEGRACIRGRRVTVGIIVGQIGADRSSEDLLTELPYLDCEDVLEALRCAAWMSHEADEAVYTSCTHACYKF